MKGVSAEQMKKNTPFKGNTLSIVTLNAIPT